MQTRGERESLLVAQLRRKPIQPLWPWRLNETDRRRLADWLVSHIGAPYDFAHAWTLGCWFLKLRAPLGRPARR